MARRTAAQVPAKAEEAIGNPGVVQDDRDQTSKLPKQPELDDIAKARIDAAVAAGDFNAALEVWCLWFLLATAHRKSEVAKKLYDISDNPLHVWSAYRLHRAARYDLPAWILEYFDRVASKLFELEKAIKRGEKIEPATAAAAALEIGQSGRGNFFKNFGEYPGWAGIAANVYERIKQGDKETYAIEVVAGESGKSKSTVRRAWKKATDSFPELVSQSRRHSET
jgi:hypothetical protein